MLSFPRSVPRFGTLLAVVTAVALSGCSGKDDAPTEPVAGDPPSATTAPATPTPSSTPTESATPTDPAVPLTLTDRLLPTAAVPGLNAAWRWQDGTTGPPGAKPFEACSRASLVDIGATDAMSRTYFPPDDSDDNAGQQVAEFPDAKTTATAWSVLGSWRARCGEEFSGTLGPQAGKFISVPVPNGVARWYLVTLEKQNEDTGRFMAVGMIRNGNRITVLQMNNSGQDYNYPAGKEPMVAMIRAAAPLQE